MTPTFLRPLAIVLFALVLLLAGALAGRGSGAVAATPDIPTVTGTTVVSG